MVLGNPVNYTKESKRYVLSQWCGGSSSVKKSGDVWDVGTALLLGSASTRLSMKLGTFPVSVSGSYRKLMIGASEPTHIQEGCSHQTHVQVLPESWDL
ncbi:hypothetical protein IHE44_0006126 [Lamprotornis superbus]|uniref:Uncharacterized protein n=1 Tax=Lamprotornis superbus TaxID=245042 RepID=A0A835U331_9PASS|nr:hypothetical protein IHE44_0006126 [Lamprotornis superbus]